MFVTVAAVGMMQMVPDQVVGVIPVGHCLVATVRSVGVLLRVGFARVIRRAGCWISLTYAETVLVDVTAVVMMQVTVVQIVDVAVVLNRDVATTGTMLMGMAFVNVVTVHRS